MGRCHSLLFGVPVLALFLAGCGDGGQTSAPTSEPSSTKGSGSVQTQNDGVTLSSSTPQRVTGSYADHAGNTLTFDLAKVNDDVFVDLTGNAGRPILRIETNGDEYDFTYMGGGLTMRTTKQFVAEVRAQTQTQPDSLSTSGFAFSGDMHVLDDMINLPEMKELPVLSRALGVRGLTGSDYPAVLALHKTAQQAAQSLSVNVAKLDTPQSLNGYCQAYPNQSNDCYGMCGPDCSCWSWVCGDCCYHYGCAVHDSWCREGEWWYCYNITAVIALFGC
ncbi:MAG TPA: hypothetical protein VMI75_15195 [Polyangiaceae bacterium]|nr:hypothetical protein [Polyangiaceae bacterium]